MVTIGPARDDSRKLYNLITLKSTGLSDSCLDECTDEQTRSVPTLCGSWGFVVTIGPARDDSCKLYNLIILNYAKKYASCCNNTAMHNICSLMLIFMTNTIFTP